METQMVSSTDIESVGYDSSTSTLEIRFHSRGVYHYFNVPLNVYQNLMSASSHGKYFAAHIKNVYRYTKIG
jgi:hypothetical protein